MRFHVEHLLAVVALVVALPGFAKGVEVRFPGPPGVELVGRLYLPEAKERAPAVVLMHGCSGMWGRDGETNRNYDAWAEHFRKHGFVALLVDSFKPRGQNEICTLKDRPIQPGRDRARDAYAALAWLANRDDVDPKSVHVMGWSNGGTSVLNTVRANAPGHTADGPQFRSAVAFYPGCKPLGRTPYKPTAPLLIQTGAADDWTPAKPCEDLAEAARKRGADVQIDVYPDAHHAFDGVEGKVRTRPNVSNPSSPTGWGATVGPNPEAREKAWKRATEFIEAHR
jgi:dienelactone hydrolase